MLGKITITSSDLNLKIINENVGYTNAEVYSSDTSIAQAFDTFGRAIIGLTTNTYRDTTVTYEYSINEILEDAEE